MERETLRAYCLSKNGAGEDFPFGDDVAVLKVMGKMFALISIETPLKISLKCDPVWADALRQTYTAVKPGWFKNHWNSVEIDGSIPDDEILEMVDHSYELVFKTLTRAQRKSLVDLQA